MKIVDATENPIAARIRAIAEKAIADGAVTFLATWETRDRMMVFETGPDSHALAVGMVARLSEHLDGVE